MTGNEFMKNTFMFDLRDEKCFWGDLTSFAELEGVGAIDFRDADERAGQYLIDGEENPALEKKAKKQLSKWKKAFGE